MYQLLSLLRSLQNQYYSSSSLFHNVSRKCRHLLPVIAYREACIQLMCDLDLNCSNHGRRRKMDVLMWLQQQPEKIHIFTKDCLRQHITTVKSFTRTPQKFNIVCKYLNTFGFHFPAVKIPSCGRGVQEVNFGNVSKCTLKSLSVSKKNDTHMNKLEKIIQTDHLHFLLSDDIIRSI